MLRLCRLLFLALLMLSSIGLAMPEDADADTNKEPLPPANIVVPQGAVTCFLDLPDDVIQHMMQFLTVEELIALRKVSHQIARLVYESFTHQPTNTIARLITRYEDELIQELELMQKLPHQSLNKLKEKAAIIIHSRSCYKRTFVPMAISSGGVGYLPSFACMTISQIPNAALYSIIPGGALLCLASSIVCGFYCSSEVKSAQLAKRLQEYHSCFIAVFEAYYRNICVILRWRKAAILNIGDPASLITSLDDFRELEQLEEGFVDRVYAQIPTLKDVLPESVLLKAIPHLCHIKRE